MKGQKAIYESTFFERALEHDAEASKYFGELRCPEIDDLIDKYADCERTGRQPPLDNPTYLLKRDRTGLHSDHPFIKRLYAVAAAELKVVMATRRPAEEDSVASDETSKRFESLAPATEKFLAEKAEESDDEVRTGSIGLGLPPGLHIIPSSRVIHPGGSVSLSLVSVGKPLEGLDTPVVTRSPALRLGYDIGQWVASPQEEGTHNLVLRFQATQTLGAWDVNIDVAGRRLPAAAVRVALPEAPEPPEGLEFDHKTYSLRVGKPKMVRLLAPLSRVDGSATVSIASDSPDVVVRGGGRVELNSFQDPPRMEGTLQVISSRVGATATLTAGLNGETAKAKAVVEQGPGPKVRFGLTRRTIRRCAIVVGDARNRARYRPPTLDNRSPQVSRSLPRTPQRWQVPGRGHASLQGSPG